MTCIVALKHGGNVHMGADSAGVDGLIMTIRRDPKLFHHGGYLFGFTTSFRMGQALMFGWSPPKRHQDTDLFEFMVTEFIDAVRARLRGAGFMKVDSNVEQGGQFLVAVEGRIFVVESDFQVGESVDLFAAVGCGAEVANGAMTVLCDEISSMPPGEILRIALGAAERHSAGVSAPFIYKSN